MVVFPAAMIALADLPRISPALWQQCQSKQIAQLPGYPPPSPSSGFGGWWWLIDWCIRQFNAINDFYLKNEYTCLKLAIKIFFSLLFPLQLECFTLQLGKRCFMSNMLVYMLIKHGYILQQFGQRSKPTKVQAWYRPSRSKLLETDGQLGWSGTLIIYTNIYNGFLKKGISQQSYSDAQYILWSQITQSRFKKYSDPWLPLIAHDHQLIMLMINYVSIDLEQ